MNECLTTPSNIPEGIQEGIPFFWEDGATFYNLTVLLEFLRKTKGVLSEEIVQAITIFVQQKNDEYLSYKANRPNERTLTSCL